VLHGRLWNKNFNPLKKKIQKPDISYVVINTTIGIKAGSKHLRYEVFSKGAIGQSVCIVYSIVRCGLILRS